MNKRHLATVLVFVIFISGLTILDLLKEPIEISIGERRKLAQAPEFSAEGLFDGEYAKEYAAFLQDQVVYRDDFRGIKSLFERRVLLKAENNGVYIIGDTIYDKFYGINQRYIDRAAVLMSSIADSIDSSGTYLALIPSKAQVLDRERYLLSDQSIIADTLRENTNATYIDLMDMAEQGDGNLYYRTDHHWTTQGAIEVYQVLAEAMGCEPIREYDLEEVSDSFTGSLYGRAAVWSIAGDSIHLAHNELLDGMAVCRYKTLDDRDCFDSVYFREKLTGLDPYDVFVGGAAPIIVIENPGAPTDQELVVFKDSYSHVLAPFLAQHFRRTMLVDLRYVRRELILDNFDLDGRVVLFMYSTIVLNTNPQILN